MLAAVADGQPVLHVFARFSASTGLSMSNVRTIYYRGRDERTKHNANSLLSATEDQVLLCATQACSYANFALTRSQLGDLVRSIWGKKVGTTWARAWVERHRDDLSVRTCRRSQTSATPLQRLNKSKTGWLSWGASCGSIA